MTQPRINYSQLQYIFSDKVKIEVFDSSKSYKKDVLVQYGDMVYMSLEDITPGEFDETKWRGLGKNYKAGIGLSIQDKIITNTLSINKLQDYLYTYESSPFDATYEDATSYFDEYFHNQENNLGACSSFRKGNFYARNYDWYYDNKPTFVVHNRAGSNRFESIGISQISINQSEVDSGIWDEKLRYVPFFMLDGINEHGVFANTNVVPTDDFGHTTGTHPELEGPSYCTIMLVKYILDNFKTATEAVNWIRDEAKLYAPRTSTFAIETHYMIGDSEKTYVVEFINNEAVITDVTDFNPVLTNFFIQGVHFDEDDHVIPSSVTNYGTGLERYNILVDNLNNVTDADSARETIDKVKYTKSYTEIYDESGNVNPNCWKTEFAGNYSESTILPHPMDLHADSPLEDYIESGILDLVYNLYLNRSRDNVPADTWQTVHSSVYDINRRELYLVTQEGDKQYHFVFPTTSKILQNLDEEIARAKAAEQAISGGVEEEARIRAEADTRLEGLIETEEQARIAGDEALENSKQDKLTAGDGITINNNNVISTLWKKDTGEGSIVSVSNAANGGQAIGNFSVAEGFGTDAKGNYSHAEGQITTANGSCAHAEGSGTTAQADCSHAEGFNTIAQNQSEHAEGQFNKSHKANTVFGNAGNTIHSIGIGTGAGSLEEQDRRNAVEVMQNGDIYVDGIGNYDGADYTNANTVQEVISDINDSIDDLSESKQDKLIASTNIQIADDGKTISATDTIYTAGNGLTLTGTEFSANVVDNVTSTSSTNALSANMGKELQDQIDNLKARGRYLSQWNAVTGQPATQPTELPYPYKTGDYYLVGTVGEVNYKPTGTSYTGAASTTVETAELGIDDVYFFDGTVWHLQQNTQKTVTFASLAGSPYDNSNLSSALNDKVDKTSSAKKIYGTDTSGNQTTYDYDSFGKVDDVKVDGVSVVTNKIANIDLTGKQDVLTAGDNITISDDTISADVPLKGVKVNNVDLTIDSNKKVNLPIADGSNLGLVKVESSSSDRGVQISSGVLQTVPSNNSQIDAENSNYTVITPTNLNYAVKKGIINNNIILTENEKTAAKTWIGANATYNSADEEIIFG